MWGRAFVLTCVAGCSFTDGAAASGPANDAARHNDAVGDGADATRAIDAAIGTDSPLGFDPTTCPATYMTIGTLTSRYRWNPTNTLLSWQLAEAACEADHQANGPPLHLAVFDDDNERTTVMAVVGPDETYNYCWTGVYESAMNSAWTKITGGAKSDAGWAVLQPAWEPPTPPTNPDGEMVYLESYYAHATNNYYNYVCECDGKAPQAIE